jgi:anti-sigma factor RsiW
MNHDEIRAELSELRDGELSPGRREAVGRHVEACAFCRAEMRDWERLSKALLRRPAAPTPQETARFVRSVMSRLPQPRPARPSFWEMPGSAGWLTPALGLASAALVLSFMPYATAARSAAAPVFVADGQEVSLSPAASGRVADVGEAVGVPDEAR